jgi:hypothetical protein
MTPRGEQYKPPSTVRKVKRNAGRSERGSWPKGPVPNFATTLSYGISTAWMRSLQGPGRSSPLKSQGTLTLGLQH